MSRLDQDLVLCPVCRCVLEPEKLVDCLPGPKRYSGEDFVEFECPECAAELEMFWTTSLCVIKAEPLEIDLPY